MPNNVTTDKKTVKELIQLIAETDLTEIEYETEAFRVRLVRNNGNINPNYFNNPQQQFIAPQNNQNQQNVVDTNKEKDYSQHAGLIKSPMVGVAYLSPEPGAPTYIKEGDTVTSEQTLLLIEAMKTFNPVKSTKSGKVVKILVKDGMPVEYGEPLMVLE